MSELLLDAQNLVKRYGSVEALRGASFQARAGEVTALIGDNGAGKSTLVKCLSGAEQPTSGKILLDGSRWCSNPPPPHGGWGSRRCTRTSRSRRNSTRPRTCSSAGRSIARASSANSGMLDKKEMKRQAVEEFQRLGVTLQSTDVPIGSLSGGQRQSVAVARSVVWASKVVFMDEPTAALGVVQRERVLDVIKKVRDKGIAVVLISHNMPEVLSVADRVEVLRLGKRVARFTGDGTKLEDLVAAMTGALVQEEAA